MHEIDRLRERITHQERLIGHWENELLHTQNSLDRECQKLAEMLSELERLKRRPGSRDSVDYADR